MNHDVINYLYCWFYGEVLLPSMTSISLADEDAALGFLSSMELANGYEVGAYVSTLYIKFQRAMGKENERK